MQLAVDEIEELRGLKAQAAQLLANAKTREGQIEAKALVARIQHTISVKMAELDPADRQALIAEDLAARHVARHMGGGQTARSTFKRTATSIEFPTHMAHAQARAALEAMKRRDAGGEGA